MAPSWLRYSGLREALSAALRVCEENILSRARDMFLALDTTTFQLVAAFENSTVVPVRLPAKTMGEVLTGLQENLAFRQIG